ncbi:MAG: hypothetical protein KAY37_04485 [Phycisphaerae bacterium]|nr:hypothetical protein [Phycisphaerae bacterium]
MKYSTGRESKVKHSTGDTYDIWVRAHKRKNGPRCATGEYAAIKHFTGRYYDLKREEELEAERAEREAAMYERPQRA